MRATVLALAAVLAALGLAYWRPVIHASTPGTRTVAVLPFADLSAERGNDYFGDGMADELIGALGRVQGLRVVARSSAFAFKGRNTDAREVGRRLGAAMVLEGSVRRSGERVRITAQLVDAASGYQLWAESYDRDLQDVLAVQEDIARGIVGALRVELRAEESARLGRRATADETAHTLYLEGRYVAGRRTADGYQQAIAYFRQAIARDPTYALAYAGLADAYTLLGYSGAVPQSLTRPQARAAAERAIALDATLAEAHTALGYVRESERDYAAAEAAFRTAIRLEPSYATAHQWLGYMLVLLGRTTDGLAELRAAARLDPLSLPIGIALGQALAYARDLDGAVRQFRDLLALQPDHPDVLFRLGYADEERGRYVDAAAALRRSLELRPDDPGALAVLAAAAARSGNRPEAKRILDRLRAKPEGRALIYTAGLQFVLGDVDAGFRALQRVYDVEPTWLMSLRVEPWLDGVRRDPRYARLVAQMHLPPPP